MLLHTGVLTSSCGFSWAFHRWSSNQPGVSQAPAPTGLRSALERETQEQPGCLQGSGAEHYGPKSCLCLNYSHCSEPALYPSDLRRKRKFRAGIHRTPLSPVLALGVPRLLLQSGWNQRPRRPPEVPPATRLLHLPLVDTRTGIGKGPFVFLCRRGKALFLGLPLVVC